ncbi:universal stress protein [Pseudomonas monteilii]|uniref:Universal stress protein n=1 Tax=Pseudomonas putida TaxID=303 RepID=M4YRF4_PSEPU|nr:universal stress protein [Pseudomonas monteilii]AGI56047.1 universal stress protein [Pseudomonas putida]MDD2126969.1 universal stress protein [Pseudomonas monteilii]
MRNVLLPFDGSVPARHAVQYLLNIIEDYPNLQIHMINVQAEPKLYGNYVSASLMEQLRAGALERSLEVLAEGTSSLEATGVRCEPHAAVGDVAEEIVRAVKEYACDTVIMGTRGMSNLGNLLMGSVATRVLHEVSVPVLLVK